MADTDRAIRLGQYELLKYTFGAFLTCSDVATDILIATTYYQHHQFIWFSFCLAFAVLPSFLLTVAYLLQSCRQEPAMTLVKQCLFYANPCGSGILKVKLLLVCLRNYDEVWSYQGWLVEDEKLRQDYRAEKVYHYVEGLLENMPQMILQIYVTVIQDDSISAIQIFSISVTFLNLVWVLTLFEYSSFVKEATRAHFTAIIFYNACIIAARGLSIVAFLVAFKWITSAVLGFHEFVCISIYLYRNHEYFTERKYGGSRSF
ncbi:XK, Kell blood group complex subunit-, member 9 [Desmophyllum pertusum]|uniref:XK-related protein n=1 Tax=Desmophyllum pertusum TaxID=174260 RepID=A0A9W9YSK0_9CNID|nr:XK, Kell blood group complex subunit-, member 9 [Desmophyllum pertusum]